MENVGIWRRRRRRRRILINQNVNTAVIVEPKEVQQVT
jgi:hypothetical protein